MSLQERNKIVPQMVDYDKIGDRWLPYLMRFDRPGRKFKHVSTGPFGFRDTVDVSGEAIQNPSGIVLGSSAVFGVGATSNAATIPSVLNRITNTEWANYGGRAFNSTQEQLLLALHPKKEIKEILVCSGVNNLTLAFLSSSTSAVYNSFFYQSAFERAMAHSQHINPGIRNTLFLLYDQVRARILRAGNSGEMLAQLGEENYKNVLSSFQRDLTVLKTMSDGLQATLSFALQPLATWLEKTLSAEEAALFEILDRMSGDWAVLADKMSLFRDRYYGDVESICRALDIPFTNLNLAPEFVNEDWLFVDRVHLTDMGYKLTAEVLKREFQL